MDFKTEISSDIDKKNWDKLLKQNSAATASQMADCYLPHQLTYNSKMLNTKFKFGTVLRWSHGPIIHDMDNAKEIVSAILDAVDKIALKNKINVISGTSTPQIENIPTDVFRKNNYEIKPWITYVTDLDRDVDEIYHALHNKTRYDVRKGEKSNLEFEVLTTRESMDYYLNIKYPDEKMQKKIRAKYDKFNDNIWKSLVKTGYKQNFVVRNNGIPEAVITNFLFNRNVSQVGVSTSNINKYAGTFITWNAIKWAAENGFRTYDVGGANPNPTSTKEKGINLFKSKWASRKINYFICTKIVDKKKYSISRIIKQPSTIKHRLNKKTKKELNGYAENEEE